MKKTITAISLCIAAALTGCATDSGEPADKGAAYAFQASESTASRFYGVDGDAEQVTYGTYVEKADLPGMPSEECTGATKLAFHSSSYRSYDKLYLQLSYTATELEELKSTYKSAKFSVYFETVPSVSIVYQAGSLHMLSFVEFYNSGWSNNQVHRNTWSSYEIYLSDLIACMATEETASDEKKAYVFAGYFSNGREILDATMNVYLSDVTLVKK